MLMAAGGGGSGVIEYRTNPGGARCRVHREYVDVVARFGRDGQVDPVAVLWRDGRSFVVDEVLERGTFGADTRGRRQARYRVRFGGHETDLWLERRDAVPAVGEEESLRWWVFAYDQTKPGHAPEETEEATADGSRRKGDPEGDPATA